MTPKACQNLWANYCNKCRYMARAKYVGFVCSHELHRKAIEKMTVSECNEYEKKDE
jgi:hypothetical protein